MSNKLKISIENNTALITINNPPANTWDLESLGFLEETINNLNNNKTDLSFGVEIVCGALQGGEICDEIPSEICVESDPLLVRSSENMSTDIYRIYFTIHFKSNTMSFWFTLI